MAIAADVPARWISLKNFIMDVVSRPKDARLRETLHAFFDAPCEAGDGCPQFYQIRDAVDYILFLKSRVFFLQKNNALMVTFIKNTRGDFLTADESLMRLIADEKDILEAGNDIAETLAEFSETPEDILAVLKNVEAVLILQYKKMQVVNDGLRSLKLHVMREMRNVDELRLKNDYLTKMTEMLQQIKTKEAVIAEQNQEMQNLKKKVDQLTLGLDTFRGRLQQAGERMDGLLNNIASASLDLYQKEQDAASNRQLADVLARESQEIRERLLLVQHIIQEKDDHIQQLEEEMMHIQTRLDMQDSGGAVRALRGEMGDAIDDLKKEIAYSQGKIRRLEEKFQHAALVNAQLESELNQKKNFLTLLEAQKIQQDSLIQDLEKGFQLRVQQLEELKGVIKIYQLKLSDYRKIVQEQDRLIKESQMGRMMPMGGGLDERFDHPQASERNFQIPDTLLWSPDTVRDISKGVLNQIFD